MKTLGAREKSNTTRENDSTNRSCRKKNLNSGKSSSTEQSNSWNAIYKILSGKLRSTHCLTTLKQSEWTFTLDAESTIKHMLHYFVPEDNKTNGSAVHKQIRDLI